MSRAHVITHLEVLVEEPSAEAVLRVLLPRIVPDLSWAIHSFDGKDRLLRGLPDRLGGYSRFATEAGICVAVLVDRDRDDCLDLKNRLVSAIPEHWRGARCTEATPDGLVLLRIACEELEAWFFGDVDALRAAYPRLPVGLGEREPYRDPDGIRGGTAEALERLLIQAGYVNDVMPKVAVATRVAPFMNVEENMSVSFCHFRDGVRRLAQRAA